MNLRIHRLAVAEIDHEVDYYESRQAGLGTELEDEIDAAFSLILRFPEAAPQWRDRPDKLPEEVPLALRMIVEKCLEKDPADRRTLSPSTGGRAREAARRLIPTGSPAPNRGSCCLPVTAEAAASPLGARQPASAPRPGRCRTAS